MEKSKHRELSLRPYPGKILHCHTLEELRAQYESKTGQSCPYKDDPNGGRFVPGTGPAKTGRDQGMEAVQRFVRSFTYENIPWFEAQEM